MTKSEFIKAWEAPCSEFHRDLDALLRLTADEAFADGVIAGIADAQKA